MMPKSYAAEDAVAWHDSLPGGENIFTVGDVNDEMKDAIDDVMNGYPKPILIDENYRWYKYKFNGIKNFINDL